MKTAKISGPLHVIFLMFVVRFMLSHNNQPNCCHPYFERASFFGGDFGLCLPAVLAVFWRNTNKSKQRPQFVCSPKSKATKTEDLLPCDASRKVQGRMFLLQDSHHLETARESRVTTTLKTFIRITVKMEQILFFFLVIPKNSGMSGSHVLGTSTSALPGFWVASPACVSTSIKEKKHVRGLDTATLVAESWATLKQTDLWTAID